jgi:hypothetical protein
LKSRAVGAIVASNSHAASLTTRSAAREKSGLKKTPMSSHKERTETHAVAAPLTKKEIHRVFYGLMLGGFLSAVNQTIVATALPTIGRDLGDFENLSWVHHRLSLVVDRGVAALRQAL